MASSPKAPADPIDARLVRKLADILTDTGLSEIEVEHGGLKIRVAKTLTAAPVHVAAPASVAMAAPAAATPFKNFRLVIAIIASLSLWL